MNETELKDSYELAKTLEITRRKLFDMETRLKRLEHLEILLRMWMKDVDACEEGAACFTNGRDEMFRDGYKEAQLAVENIISNVNSMVNNTYKGLLDKFEKE